MNQKFLRQHELAEFLHVTPRQLRYWQTNKVIPFFKLGRVVLFDVDRVMTALERFERKAAI